MNDTRLDDRYRTYLLQMSLEQDTLVEVGALTEHRFASGCYLYVGSARSGLTARLTRHHADEKTKHWHIDYLVHHARITAVFVSGVPECELNRRLRDRYQTEQPVKNFGSSDCDCHAHLALLTNPEGFGGQELKQLDPDTFRP
jgi:Uri superfamily endonuclease